MPEKIDVIVANPAGNTTIFVLTPFPVSKYQEITDKVLSVDFKDGYGISFTEGNYDKEIKGEQVGFILPDVTDPQTGEILPAMNMSGLEFCGNASRAFAYIKASETGKKEIRIKVSGCDYPLNAWVDVPGNDSKVQMPIPSNCETLTAGQIGYDGVLVNMDGISHLVLKGVEATPETFDAIKDAVYSLDDPDGNKRDMPALGVMFIDEENDTMAPVVYVRDVDTTYFEGSCASGTTAAAYVRALSMEDGTHYLTFREPAGTLYTEIKKESGKLTEIKLNGLVEISDVITLEL